MGAIGRFGFTCDSCPSRGYYEDEPDWVRVGGTQPNYKPLEGSRGTLSYITHYTTPKWINLSYPDRCKQCNARYQSYKRAREAISRLEIVRKTFEDFGGERWKYLKFVTLTFPIIADQYASEREAIDSVDKTYRTQREKLAELLEVQGGTDVLESVTKVTPSGTTYNVHYHGVWLMPLHPIEKISAAMEICGFGRDQVRAIKEKAYTDSFGKQRIQDAHKVAADYLSKYMSKENTHKRRKVWGELRKWKEYLDDEICRICIKTTHDIEKQYPCNCESDSV